MARLKIRKAPVVFAGFVIPACLAIGQSVCAADANSGTPYHSGASNCMNDTYAPEKCIPATGSGNMCTYNWSATPIVLYSRAYNIRLKKCQVTGYKFVYTDSLDYPGADCGGGG